MSFFSRFFIPKPFNDGYLPELDGHEVYYAQYGNPQGKPILMFHGGPGYYSRAEKAKDVNLKNFRVIMFDQRGGGKSKPAGRLEMNTTQNLLDDVVRLLDYLKIEEKIILYGGSWGSTLALLFAEQYPDMVEKLVLSKIFLADKKSRNWELRDSGLFYPDILEAIKGDLPDNGMIPEYYSKLINSGDASQQARAVALYGSYEFMLGSLDPKIEVKDVEDARVVSTRIYMHYSAQDFMLEDGEIMDNIGKIRAIPTLIVHNRLDFICPLEGAYRLHKAMTRSKLVIVPEKGHGGPLSSKINKKEVREFLKNE